MVYQYLIIPHEAVTTHIGHICKVIKHSHIQFISRVTGCGNGQGSSDSAREAKDLCKTLHSISVVAYHGWIRDPEAK